MKKIFSPYTLFILQIIKMTKNKRFPSLKKGVTHISSIVIWMIYAPILLEAQTIQTTEVDFPILNGKMALKGVISQSKNTQIGAPILVLVSPPQPFNRNYGGFFKALSDTLNKHGFVTFRYDNRNFSDTTTTKPCDGRYTMHDGADDLHDALTFLKKQNRPIGLVGHSEGGSISIIEAARNKEVKFLLLLSTSGIPGEQFSYSQSVARFAPWLDRLPPQETNLIKYGIYYPIHILANNPNNKIAFSKLRAEARRFYKENHNFSFHGFNNGNYSETLFGKLNEDEYVEKTIEQWTKNARSLAFMRYNPADYIPTIKCPVFIAYPQNDNLMRYKENQENLERILMDNRHFDYQSIVIDSVTHTFENSGGIDLPIYVSVHRKYKHFLPGNGFMKLCKHMIDWIENKTQINNKM